MSATLAIAVIGAVTGVIGLAWQVLSFALAGSRIQIYASYSERDIDSLGDSYIVVAGGDAQRVWYVDARVANVGRMDASLVGYTVWMDWPGHRIAKLRWRVRAWRTARGRTPMVTFQPSVSMLDDAMIETGGVKLQLPTVLEAGQMVRCPPIGLNRVAHNDPRLIRVAVHLGSGDVVKARAISRDDLRPLEIKGADNWLRWGT